MLKKTERLGRQGFTSFFKQGRRFHSDHLTVVYSPSPTFHASVVVSKKVHKQAVVRNTLRRRVYAELYRYKKNTPTGVFIVVLKPSFAKLTRGLAQEHLQALIERITKPA